MFRDFVWQGERLRPSTDLSEDRGFNTPRSSTALLDKRRCCDSEHGAAIVLAPYLRASCESAFGGPHNIGTHPSASLRTGLCVLGAKGNNAGTLCVRHCKRGNTADFFPLLCVCGRQRAEGLSQVLSPCSYHRHFFIHFLHPPIFLSIRHHRHCLRRARVLRAPPRPGRRHRLLSA